MAIEESSGVKRDGQHFDSKQNRIEQFTEQMMEIAQAKALQGNANTEIIPQSKLQALVRVYTPPTADILAYVDSVPGTVNLQFPDVLTGITVTFNKTEGDGFKTHPAGTAASAGRSGGISVSPSSTAQGSATIMPDVQIDIAQVWSQNVPVVHYGFYMLVGSSIAQILARLTTIAGAAVTAWPVFRPMAHTLTLKGQQKSLTQSADSLQSNNWSTDEVGAIVTQSFVSNTATGASREGGNTIRSVRIPPTIHALITISGATSTATTTTTVTADIPAAVTSGAAPAFPAVVNEPTPLTETATASVSPTSLAATIPSAIPTSGIRLLDLSPIGSEWGYTFLKATVFDFANLA